MHDAVVTALRGSAKRVLLMAALRDPRLGSPGVRHLRVFIPDIHLVSRQRRRALRYGTNAPEMLTRVCSSLLALKRRLGEKVVQVYQLGDYVDLWREQPRRKEGWARRIIDDNAELDQALRHRQLDPEFIYGNHDIELYRERGFLRWQRRLFVAPGQDQPESTLIIHGDVFDWIEKAPDAIQNELVFRLGPKHEVGTIDLAYAARWWQVRFRSRTWAHHIQTKCPPDIGEIVEASVGGCDTFNVHDAALGPVHKYFSRATRLRRRLVSHYPGQLNLRLIVIGHTHHGGISVEYGDDGDLFALMDCGAWIERCRYNGREHVNAQIGVLCDNEVRLYQLEE